MNLTKRKNGYYYLKYFDPSTGKILRISAKTKNKKEALAFFKSFNDDLFPEPVKIRISDFEKQYVSDCRIIFSKSYVRSIELSFRFLKQFVGNKFLNEITVPIANQFLMETYQRTPKGAELFLRTLKAAFSKAIVLEYIHNNVFKKIKLPKSPTKKPIIISRDELHKMLSQTNEVLFQHIFILAFNSGLRLGEIINLKWEAINLERRRLLVQNTATFTTKSKNERIIPISNELFNTLIKHKNCNNYTSSNYVFTKIPGVRLNPDYVSKNFKKLVKAAQLDDSIHFHSLRHSFASYLVQKGVSLFVVKELMGHADISTTQIYSHLQIDNLHEAISVFNL